MKFKQDNKYRFRIEKLIDIPETGSHYILFHKSGVKLLLKACYYLDYNLEIGQVIEGRVDKINCTGQIFIEPIHPVYEMGKVYNFTISKVTIIDKHIKTICLLDCFKHSIDILTTNKKSYLVGQELSLRVKKIKKGRPILTISENFHDREEILINNEMELYLRAVIMLNNEQYYLLTRNEYYAILKVRHYKHYNLNVGEITRCNTVDNLGGGLLKVEPLNPWYKIGESYLFTNLNNELNNQQTNPDKTISILDKQGKKSGVIIPDEINQDIVSKKKVWCKVLGFRKGRPLLEIDLKHYY